MKQKLVFLRLQTKFAILYQVVISEIFFRQNHLNKLSAFSPNVIFGILSVHRDEFVLTPQKIVLLLKKFYYTLLYLYNSWGSHFSIIIIIKLHLTTSWPQILWSWSARPGPCRPSSTSGRTRPCSAWSSSSTRPFSTRAAKWIRSRPDRSAGKLSSSPPGRCSGLCSIPSARAARQSRQSRFRRCPRSRSDLSTEIFVKCQFYKPGSFKTSKLITFQI